MRRSIYFRPLSVTLVFTLLRIPLLFPFGSPQPAFAGADPCTPSSERIIQDLCEEGQPPHFFLQSFEQETVEAWLAAHELPPSAAALVYEHGRSDLRSLLRAQMFARILGIIHKEDRTVLEQNVYNWFLNRVQKKEVGLYQYAVDERDRWLNDPCNWEPDPDIAETYGLYYTGGAFCSGGLASLFSTKPQVPAKSYFITAGFKESYGSKIAAESGGARVLAETTRSLMPAIGLIAGGAMVAAAGVTLLVSIGFKLIFPFAASIGAKGGAALTLSAGLVAGPLAIVLFAVLVGGIAAFQLFEGQQTLDQLAKLDSELANAQSNPVSLTALATTDEGMMRLSMTFVEATLPEFSSTSTLPARESDDPLFYLGFPPMTLTPDLTYRDWEGDVWTATPHAGFLIQEGTENGGPVTSFSTLLRFVDPVNGEKLTADIIGTKFLVTRSEPTPDQEPCYADPVTGLSNENDVSQCSSYVVSVIDLRDGNGLPETVRFATQPSFTSLPTTTFTEGVQKTFQITATGAPLPTITFDGDLPAGFSFVSASETGIASLVYDGTTAIGANEHTEIFSATNGRGTVEQTFTIRTGTALEFTSEDMPTFVSGKPISFLFTTSGSPVPEITIPNTVAEPCLAFSYALTDHGDGTATWSGTPLLNTVVNPSCVVVADNGLERITQTITPTFVEPALAQLTGESSTTFFSGTLNSFGLSTNGAETPVTIELPCGFDVPSWVSINDHGNGTATLFGNPPFGTDGSFSFFVDVDTFGQLETFFECTSDPGFGNYAPNFTIHVSSVPTFLSRSRVEFGPPPFAGTVFLVTTNQASGLISMEGELPAGVSFIPNENDGSATIQGIPAVGTGGVYPLVLSMTNGAGQTGSQFLRLHVKEAPGFVENAFDSAVFYVGLDNRLVLPTTGFPKTTELIGQTNPVEQAMSIEVDGALPPHVSFSDSIDFDIPTPNGVISFEIPTGSGVFAGIPEPGSEGTYPLTLTASNGVFPDGTLDFTLFVVQPGDVNRDGIVDQRDLDEIRESLNKSFADPDYDHLIDTNRDGIIDEDDIEHIVDSCPDPDGDGACESTVDDRDGDGIVDSNDYDPTGYLYDVSTGEILSGGLVTVTPAPASMPFDGSSGFYQFFVSPGETVYTLTVQSPVGCRPMACPRLDPPPLDPMGMSIVLGSSEAGNTGALVSADCADNPYTLTFQLGEAGDEVLLNNIPFDCSPTPAPALDARGIFLALLVLLWVAASRRRRSRNRLVSPA